MRTLLATLFMFLSSTSAAIAGDATTENHRTAALELLKVLDLEGSLAGGAAALANFTIEQNPELEPYREVIHGWAAKYINWANFEPKYVALYVEAYSESELRELIAFYQTPIGKKMIQYGPELERRGELLGNEVAEEYRAELSQMIDARGAELEKSASSK